MSALLDKAQIDAPIGIPALLRAFLKTDGVEHNLYIGQAIAPAKRFNETKLYNLRLWQLQVMCELEAGKHHYLKNHTCHTRLMLRRWYWHSACPCQSVSGWTKNALT